jgi:PAS domain S-box-containing protein
MGVSGAKQAVSRVPRQGPGAAGQPSARARASLLEYAVGHLLPPGSPPESLGGMLARIAADFGAQGALVVAPGSAQPLGEEAAHPPEIATDLVLLAQIRSAWAEHGGRAATSGQPFQVDLDSGRRRVGLLIVPAEPAAGQRPCALALIGDVSRWKAGARSTLKAIATVVAALLMRAAEATSIAPGPLRPGPGSRGPDPVGEGPVRRNEEAAALSPALAGPGLEPPSPAGHDSLARALVAGAPSAIVAVDAGRRIREFNPSAEELFGRRRADVLGLDMPDLLVPEEFRQSFVDAMAGFLATGDRSEVTLKVRLRALRADGTERSIELTPMPVTVAGETYFFGFMRDASELENANVAAAEGDARFRLLSDLAPVGIVQTDVEGRCTFVNDTWCEMAGIAPSEALGRTWRDTINPEDVERLDAMRDQSGTPTELASDCRLQTAFGREVWVHAVVRRIVDQNGNLVGRVAALTDVHHRKRTEAAKDQDRRLLAEQNVELRGLNEAKVRYLATVSHELRTPLTSIVSFAELMRSEVPGLAVDPGEYLDIIQRNAERLLRVVGDLMDLNGLEEGISRLELAPISVPWVARESVRTGWSIATADGIRLDVSSQDGPDVQGDGGRLQQVLVNLISNAVKFSVTGGHVEVRATHNSREWRIDVTDAGIGIPAGEVDHLFDRFFRASNARQSEVPGTGLGLPTAKAITELHGGRIEVASVMGSGTTFTVYLPIGP